MAQIKELTKAELQIMQILWDKESAFVNDIIESMEMPKPAYNTVSTIVRILEQKGFVSHRNFGKSHEYFPIVSREDYTSSFMTSVLNNFFGNSVSQMVSFFSAKENLSVTEMEEIMTIIKERQSELK